MLPLGVGLLALATLSLLPWLLHDPAVGTLRAPDGSTERILAVTEGKSHRWQRGSLADALMESPLSPLRAKNSGKPKHGEFRWESRNDYLAVWPELPGSGGGFGYEHFLKDDHGCVFDQTVFSDDLRPLESYENPIPKDEFVSLFRNYPRRSRSLFIGDVPRSGQISWIQVKCPVEPVTPAFAAPTLPQLSAKGSLAVRVRRVTALQENDPSSAVYVEILENGVRSKRWRVVRFNAEDATGNKDEDVVELDSAPDKFTVSSLCRKEAWKLRLILLPIDPARAPDQVIRLPKVPAPRPERESRYSKVVRAGKTSVSVPEIGWYSPIGNPRAHLTAMLSFRTPLQPFVAIATAVGGSRPRALGPKEVIDSHQHPWEFVNPTYAWLVRDQSRYYDFPLTPGRPYRDMVVKLYYPRTIEVRFQP